MNAVIRRLAALLLGCSVLLAAAPAHADPAGKYYVVGAGDYLFSIALQTLGTGDRYPEIYDLNRDRPQPDGGRMTDPTVLEAGWILLLPADAHGPGVLDAAPSTAEAPPPNEPKSEPGNPLWLVVTALVAATAIVGMAVAVLIVLRRRARPAPEPAAPSDPPPAVEDGQDLTVRGSAGALDVRVTGSSQWLPPGETPSAMGLPAELGVAGGWHLWIDLSLVPDVFTMTGDTELSRAHGRAIAECLDAAGHRVIVVGEALGRKTPASWQRLTAFPADPAGLAGVVFSGGLRGDELAAARRLTADTGGRAAPVLIGRMMPARWSAVSRAEGQRCAS
ncbi:LysM peptidoglycan-binding domain-containing protein [Paractinoplanes durhamensis]|uniref:LysM domain-containing protein n=1 Tax=Paractinoplanes durhamensis TaxID=113563 RepID=A0ABQ3Z2Y6_9ACTN|nr:LysM domain-containing protein [Actinoplanes durhamensis]GIE04189.1 hypothetical protein Adu01nite_55390 [Actinoplanes durhamensis]